MLTPIQVSATRKILHNRLKALQTSQVLTHHYKYNLPKFYCSKESNRKLQNLKQYIPMNVNQLILFVLIKIGLVHNFHVSSF